MLLPALPSASGPFVGPGDRYPNRQLKTKSVPVWLLADSQPHSLHSLKRFFWRRSIVINHFGSKGASPALPSAPPCTEARRGPILARKRWASGIAASTLSSSGAGPNPCSPTTKPEFPINKVRKFESDRVPERAPKRTPSNDVSTRVSSNHTGSRLKIRDIRLVCLRLYRSHLFLVSG